MNKLNTFLKNKNEVLNRFSPILVFMLFGLVIFAIMRLGVGGASIGRSASANSLLSQRVDHTDVRLEPVEAEDVDNVSYVQDQDVLSTTDRFSPRSSSCGGVNSGSPSFLCTEQNKDIYFSEADQAAVEGSSERVNVRKDTRLTAALITIPRYYRGLDNGDGKIEILEKGEVVDMAKVIGGGSTEPAAEYRDGKAYMSGETDGSYARYTTPEKYPEFVQTNGMQPTEFHVRPTLTGSERIEGPSEEKSATPGCEGSNIPADNPGPGCPSADLAFDQAQIGSSYNSVPLSTEEPDPLARLKGEGEELPCTTPYMMFGGETVCVGSSAVEIVYRTKRTFDVNAPCWIDSTCKHQVKLALKIQNFMGNNESAQSMSPDFSLDFVQTNLSIPENLPVSSNDTLPVSYNQPFIEDRYVGTECKIYVDGSPTDAVCIHPDYLYATHFLEKQEAPPCTGDPNDPDIGNGVEYMPFCEFEDYARFVQQTFPPENI